MCPPEARAFRMGREPLGASGRVEWGYPLARYRTDHSRLEDGNLKTGAVQLPALANVAACAP